MTMGDVQALGSNSSRDHPVLGMVPGLRDWSAGVGYRRRRACGRSNRRFDAVLRMAAGDGVRHRDRPSRHGGALGGFLSAFAGRDSLRHCGFIDGNATGDKRRGPDRVHGHVLLVGGLFQIIGSLALAFPGWGWQAADGIITFVLGLLVLGAMAGIRTLGDRSFYRDRLIFYGCAWIALALGLRSL